MVREEVLSAIAEYDKYISSQGMELPVLEAYSRVVCDVYHYDKDAEYGRKISRQFKDYMNQWIHEKTGGGFWQLESYEGGHDFKEIQMMYEVFKNEAFYDFESYMYYMEKNRPYKKRFYLPRRMTQRVVAQDLQDLEEDKLDTYGLSEPSRVGKSTIMIFFLTWVGLRKPMSHNAMGGHSGQLVKRFFRGLDNLTGTDEYTFAELFKYHNPTLKYVVERKSSDPAELTINLGAPDEFSTFTCRSADATWTGAIDVSEDGYLYVDDLVRDREHSLSVSRMNNTYQEYQNKMLDRMNDGAKKILVGTLWSVLDPLVREEKENEGNDRARFRKIPALNENDESNFQYEVKGFSSEYYRKMRERLEKPEWMAKYQQSPFKREGLTFPIETLRRFTEIPDDTHKTVAALDPAFGSGDSLSMPICCDFGEKEKYIVNWVHDKRTTAHTLPLVVNMVSEYTITELQIEKNRGGDLLAEQLKTLLNERGIGFCRIILKNAPVKMSKEDKISGYSDYVKSHFLFLDSKQMPPQYMKALEEMTMFSAEGKNINDDAPDSITQLAMMFETKGVATVEAVVNPFRKGGF